MKKQSGRKAVIALTDGVDNGSKVTLTSAIESSQRAGTLVYSILFSDQDAYGGHGPRGLRGFGGHRGGGGDPGRRQGSRTDGKPILQRLSRETGGGFFEVSKKESIEKIYDQIQEELRNQYSIGYTSDQPDAPGKYTTKSGSRRKRPNSLSKPATDITPGREHNERETKNKKRGKRDLTTMRL